MLLTNRDFGMTLDVRGLPEDATGYAGAARRWLDENWGRSFEACLAESLTEAGYDVGVEIDAADRAALIRATLDARWYVARNAAWMLERLFGRRVPLSRYLLSCGSPQHVEFGSRGLTKSEQDAWSDE